MPAVNSAAFNAAADVKPSPSMSCSARLALMYPSVHIGLNLLWCMQCFLKAVLFLLKTYAEPSPPVLCRQASSREASTAEPGQAAESGSSTPGKPSPAAIMADIKRRVGWDHLAAPQQVSDEQQMVQAAEGSEQVADGSEVRLRLFRMFGQAAGFEMTASAWPPQQGLGTQQTS